MGVIIGPIAEYRKHTLDIGAHFARLEAELRRKEAQAQSDQSSGSVGGSDQDQAGNRNYQICEITGEQIFIRRLRGQEEPGQDHTADRD